MTRLQGVISLIVVGVWVGTLIARAMHPAMAANFTSVDGAILLVFGWMFSTRAIRKPPAHKSQPAAPPKEIKS